MNDKVCLHDGGIMTYSTGGMHFSEGEPWDDICQHGVCAICGEHIDCQSCCDKMTQKDEP